MLISSNLWKKGFGCLGYHLFAGITVERVSLAASIKPHNKLNAQVVKCSTTQSAIAVRYIILPNLTC